MLKTADERFGKYRLNDSRSATPGNGLKKSMLLESDEILNNGHVIGNNNMAGEMGAQ